MLFLQLIKYILIILKFNSIITYMDLSVNTYLGLVICFEDDNFYSSITKANQSLDPPTSSITWTTQKYISILILTSMVSRTLSRTQPRILKPKNTSIYSRQQLMLICFHVVFARYILQKMKAGDFENTSYKEAHEPCSFLSHLTKILF